MVGLWADYNQIAEQSLLRIIADELKLPLTQIARRLELARIDGRTAEQALLDIEASAVAALKLMDSYMLGLDLADHQQALPLEPVSLAAVLNDTAHDLDELAKAYGVCLQLQIERANKPVMAHAAGLRAAFYSLGYALIQAREAHDEPSSITFLINRSAGGVMAGLYGGMPKISAAHLRSACRLARARQPLNQFSASSAAGVFVANLILQAMDGRLTTSRRQKQSGLAAILPASRQLELAVAR
ncbi:MAG: hypothetical protein ACREGA_02710 [Candidatus Saccharimonadales bacterium]